MGPACTCERIEGLVCDRGDSARTSGQEEERAWSSETAAVATPSASRRYLTHGSKTGVLREETTLVSHVTLGITGRASFLEFTSFTMSGNESLMIAAVKFFLGCRENTADFFRYLPQARRAGTHTVMPVLTSQLTPAVQFPKVDGPLAKNKVKLAEHNSISAQDIVKLFIKEEKDKELEE
ncbi:hypothetical protein H920_03331 [Fukomys damarensis]|uniref:Uncharacterized protein n=1 Tax=Fukomys damarensis TaxID=885580 RepID=A0A091EIC2_FUKDA|nr:hypothetical protein H920_03331 [Fukomys damarensis]